MLKACLRDCQPFVGLMKIPSTPLKCVARVLQTELPWQHGDLAQQDIFACLSKGDKPFRSSNGYFLKKKKMGLKKTCLAQPSESINLRPKITCLIRKGISLWCERLVGIRDPRKPDVKSERAPLSTQTRRCRWLEQLSAQQCCSSPLSLLQRAVCTSSYCY